MPQDHHVPPPSFPRSQRERVGLALQRGCRHRDAADAQPAGPPSQRDRVRQALERGIGGAPKGNAAKSRVGIYR
ncbi:MAG: hypothetical protein QOF29_249 [bacterium]|jgi:hypothetical protein